MVDKNESERGSLVWLCKCAHLKKDFCINSSIFLTPPLPNRSTPESSTTVLQLTSPTTDRGTTTLEYATTKHSSQNLIDVGDLGK
jgi:hypothetical protein